MHSKFSFGSGLPVCRRGYQWLEVVDAETGGPYPMLVARTSSTDYHDRSRWQRVAPTEEEAGLYRMFAELDPSPREIRRFANRFGLLTTRCWGLRHVGTDRERRTVGTSLALWRYHILTMRHWLTVWDLAAEAKEAELADYVRAATEFGPGLLHRAERGGTDAADYYRRMADVFEAAIARKKLPSAAKRLATQAIGEQLQGLRLGMEYDSEQDSVFLRASRLELETLLWLQFAEALARGRRFGRCEFCQKPFLLATDDARRSRFCTQACKLKSFQMKRKWANELHAQGKAHRHIAELLGTDLDKIEKWVGRKHA